MVTMNSKQMVKKFGLMFEQNDYQRENSLIRVDIYFERDFSSYVEGVYEGIFLINISASGTRTVEEIQKHIINMQNVVELVNKLNGVDLE
jgi:hypothetical protein